ncbi:hypothetical protein [Paracoccus saliphilus]|uniref:Flagellar assembly protein FliH n=1 Tax=Paracoccus saliphilus TaxID=405559 RepID=A0AA45W6J9_9RHOB|nr:hypothetical protein [Paracoccus saliphilus]WCR04407.1 hypothetical protein JHX88_06670 [Paracoccus saliphilus]SIT01787.1 hypothetical protein SAMN05421772_112113 [Paracoccus saliphilus]
MANAAIKLESFSPARQCPAAVTYSQDELDRAWADGRAEGRAQRESEEIEQLRSALDLLARALSDDDERRIKLRNEAVAALFPLIPEIVDALAPSVASQRLERALTGELERLARATPPVRAHISCSEKLREMVENCIGQSGMTGIEAEVTDCDRISLSLSGGSIEFSQQKIARQIRELIDEIKEDMAAWTN